MPRSIVYGNYALLGRLNAGGMAEVFLAKSSVPGHTETLLALKRLLPAYNDAPEFISMLGDEARIASGLHHRNICEIYDQGEHEGQRYLVMEFIHGKDIHVLRRRAEQRREPVPFPIAAYVIAAVADALDFAHRKRTLAGESEGIVHRDVSPQNILLGYDGVPKLIDFGVAMATYRASETKTGRIKGKFAYMSPEQARGRPLDGRSDIYSLGTVLYEVLAAAPAFEAENQYAMLRRVAEGDYVPIEQRDRQVPEPLRHIVRRALAADVQQRYPRAGDMAADLLEYVSASGSNVGEESVSAYIRRLFRDDYIRETSRIRAFRELEVGPPPRADDLAAGEVDPPQELDSELLGQTPPPDGTTQVEASFFLAAGYDGGADGDNAPQLAIGSGATGLPKRDRVQAGDPRPFVRLEEEPVARSRLPSDGVLAALVAPEYDREAATPPPAPRVLDQDDTEQSPPDPRALEASTGRGGACEPQPLEDDPTTPLDAAQLDALQSPRRSLTRTLLAISACVVLVALVAGGAYCYAADPSSTSLPPAARGGGEE